MASEILLSRRSGPDRHRLGYLMNARVDGRRCLNPVQYAYAVRIARRLQDWGNPELTADLRIRPIGGYHELKLKGNVLGNSNLRVFFDFFPEHDLVLILGAYLKDEENKTPEHIVIKMKNRSRIALRQLNQDLGRTQQAARKPTGDTRKEPSQ